MGLSKPTTIRTKEDIKNYEENYDRIFRKKKKKRSSSSNG